jgi:hypothetical protein
MPGERRGGRQRDTPNRRTILTERILAVGSEHPTAPRRALLLQLVKDQKLPADIRMAVAPRCFPAKRTQASGARPRVSAGTQFTVEQGVGEKAVDASKGIQTAPLVPDWNPLVLDALFGVVQDVTADSKARRKAALKISEFLLPKAGKKAKVIPDEYGFRVNPNLARRYRDIQLEVRSLVNEPTHIIPAIAEQIKKLEARSDAMLRRLQVPCPTKYRVEEATNDYFRLMQFTRLRDNKTALTEVQNVEEAHLKVRFDVFAASPEQIARRRRNALQDAERRFKYVRPLSRKSRSELEFLRRLYPEPRQEPSQLVDDQMELNRGYHPFQSELPAADGNFYPRKVEIADEGNKELLAVLEELKLMGFQEFVDE